MKKVAEFLIESNTVREYLDFLDLNQSTTLAENNENFFHDDLNGSLSSIGSDTFYDISKETFTEMIAYETQNIINESGSMPGVSQVPKNKAEKIVGNFVDLVLKKMKIFKLDTMAGLGSTRSMLKNLPTAKSLSGDLDLLIVSSVDNRESAKQLSIWAKSKGLDYQVAFGNIFTVAWPYEGEKYQIDLMIANPSENDEIYSYMRKFKYFSDELPVQNGDFIIKGAHRSELAKTMVKAIGLSAAENGFKQFIWDNKYRNITEVSDELRKKAERFRDEAKKQQSIDLAELLDKKVRTLDRLKSDLSENGLLRNRYPNALFKNYPKAFDLLLDMLFTKEQTTGSWEKLLDKKFGVSDSIKRMDKFEDVLDLCKELLAKRVVTPRAIAGVLNDIKSAFYKGKASGAWNKSLEEYIQKQLPFMKKYWL